MQSTSTPRQASSLLRFGAALVVFAAAIGATACSPVVIGGGSGSGGSGGGDGSGGANTGGSGDGGSVTSPNAIAILASQMGTPPPDTTSSGQSGTGTGGGVDPDTIYVQVANYGQVCPGDFPYDCAAGTKWRISVGIPPALQAPGVLQLSDQALISTFSATGSNGSPNDCWGGGGSFIDGSIEILSIDPEAGVVVKLSGTSLGIPEGGTADGEYTAPWCFAP